MKKIISLIILCLIMINSIPVYASVDENFDTNIIVSSDNIEEIKEREEYLIEYVNSTIDIHNLNPIDSSNFDYSKMLTFYYGIKFSDAEEIDNNKVQGDIKDKGYAYYLPIFSEGNTILLYIEKGEEITEEDRENLPAETIESLEKNVGIWTVTSLDIYLNKTIDYKGEIEKSLKDNNVKNSYVYFLKRVTKNIGFSALICSDNPDETRFKILNQYENSEDSDIISSYIPLDKTVLHSFDEIKAVAEKEQAEYAKMRENYGDDEILNGSGMSLFSQTEEKSNNNILIISIISGVAVVAAAVIIVCVIRKKKAKNIES